MVEGRTVAGGSAHLGHGSCSCFNDESRCVRLGFVVKSPLTYTISLTGSKSHAFSFSYYSRLGINRDTIRYWTSINGSSMLDTVTPPGDDLPFNGITSIAVQQAAVAAPLAARHLGRPRRGRQHSGRRGPRRASSHGLATLRTPHGTDTRTRRTHGSDPQRTRIRTR